MHPTLVNTQHLIASKVAYLRLHPTALMDTFSYNKSEDSSASFFTTLTPSYGDVVAFVYPVDPSKSLVKRVIGLPGDVIEVETGYVIRNGQKLQEPYVLNRDKQTISEITVPAIPTTSSETIEGTRRIHVTGASLLGTISSVEPGLATGLQKGWSSSTHYGSSPNSVVMNDRPPNW